LLTKQTAGAGVDVSESGLDCIGRKPDAFTPRSYCRLDLLLHSKCHVGGAFKMTTVTAGHFADKLSKSDSDLRRRLALVDRLLGFSQFLKQRATVSVFFDEARMLASNNARRRRVLDHLTNIRSA
jgi:hypothetical protein